ncbi:MAG: hypothetical protein JNL34_14055 [Anaerolineae bacterium]|nr:hypothetical protein [Anaerolineae bacterium]
MNRLRILLLLGVLALIVALVPAASAQDETFGLTQDEYNALTTANANTASSTSYDYSFDLTLDAASTGSSANVAIQGSGSVSDGFSLTATGSVKSDGATSPVAFGIIFSGDTLYISTDGGTTWYAGTGEELAQMFGGMLPVDPAALATGDLSELEGQMGDMTGMMSGLENLDPSQFISITAAPDGDTTVYTMTLDVGTLLSTPEMSSMLGMAMAGSSSAPGMPTPSPEEAAMMGQMIGGMFSTATATVTQTVDTAAEVVDSTVVTVSIPLDAMGTAGDGVTLTFDLSLSNYGAGAPVVAPENTLPLSQLLGGLMGGM